jgi:hypothetical protein
MTVTEPADIRFEGFTQGTEIWGSTQANFLVRIPGRHLKEAAILLNDPTARMLADLVGREDSQDFREQAARAAGELVFRDVLDRGANVDSLVMVSNAYFEQRPQILEQLKAALS